MWRIPALLLAASVSGLASDPRLGLEGTVTGAEGAGRLRVQLFSIETPFSADGLVTNGKFQFRSLAPGDYTVAVVREGLGEVRRTVVVSPSLADSRGVVATEIPYNPDDAHAGISIKRLAVPQEAVDWYSRARQDPKGGAQLLRRAVERAPDFADAWNALGVLAFQSGDLREAERCYRQAAQADPETFDAVVNLAALLLRSGRASDALEYNRRAADKRPGDALANVQLGMNYFQLGRFSEAEPYLSEAKRLDPANQMQPQLFLAEIYRQRGDAQRAVAELRDLVALRPDSVQAPVLRQKIAVLSGAGLHPAAGL